MSKDDTTILITTKNNQKTIKQVIIDLNKYQKKHRNIKNIIITDQNSQDKTIPLILQTINELQNPTINIITNQKKNAITQALKIINTNNTITLPPYPETSLNQIQKQIKLLRKCQLVIPNRHSTNTPNHYLPIKKRDNNNPNIALKTKIFKNTTNIFDLYYSNIRITRTNTHITKKKN